MAMNTYRLVWSPTGQTIGTVQARTQRAAVRKAPKPYSKYKGEIYAERQGNPMARARSRRVRLGNPGEGDVNYGEWIPAHAVKFNENGTTMIMCETGRVGNRRRNVSDGYVDGAGIFHPIRWATDYDPDRAGEEGEYSIHPSSGYYRKHPGMRRMKAGAARRRKRAAPKKKKAARRRR